MRLIYCGQATIDEKLGMRKADDAFFEFAGQRVVGAFGKFIKEEDFWRLQSAVNEIVAGKRSRDVIIVRKESDSDEDDEKYLMIEIKIDIIAFDNVKPIQLEIYMIAEDEILSEDGSWKDIQAYDAFFGMLSGIMLLYDSESGSLVIRAGIAEQILTLYHGTLSDWEQKFMVGRVDKGSEAEFVALCEDLRSGEAAFQHKIRTDAFGQEKKSMQLFTFRCRRMQQDAFFRIVGVIDTTGKTKVDPGLTDYVMDSGLPILNKKSIAEYAQRALLNTEEITYLVIMDLDDFKTVNDTYGHMFGDEVLLQMVQIVKNAIGKRGMLGRIGGDELMIVLTGVENETELRNVLRSVRTNIQWAFQEKKEGLHLTCSMGVATYPTHARTYDQMFQLADRMLYLAKKRGKNRYVIYTPEIHDAPKEKASGQNNAAVALKEDKLGVMQRVVEEFLVRRIVTLEAEFRELAACFELDVITMVYDDGASTVILNQNAFSYEADEYTYTNYEPGFLEGFDNNNLLEVNGLFSIEMTAPELCKLLEPQSIESALFYKLAKNGKMFGYVMFAKKSRRRLWAEYEKTMLGVVGKALELSCVGK